MDAFNFSHVQKAIDQTKGFSKNFRRKKGYLLQCTESYYKKQILGEKSVGHHPNSNQLNAAAIKSRQKLLKQILLYKETVENFEKNVKAQQQNEEKTNNAIAFQFKFRKGTPSKKERTVKIRKEMEKRVIQNQNSLSEISNASDDKSKSTNLKASLANGDLFSQGEPKNSGLNEESPRKSTVRSLTKVPFVFRSPRKEKTMFERSADTMNSLKMAISQSNSSMNRSQNIMKEGEVIRKYKKDLEKNEENLGFSPKTNQNYDEVHENQKNKSRVVLSPVLSFGSKGINMGSSGSLSPVKEEETEKRRKSSDQKRNWMQSHGRLGNIEAELAEQSASRKALVKAGSLGKKTWGKGDQNTEKLSRFPFENEFGTSDGPKTEKKVLASSMGHILEKTRSHPVPVPVPMLSDRVLQDGEQSISDFSKMPQRKVDKTRMKEQEKLNGKVKAALNIIREKQMTDRQSQGTKSKNISENLPLIGRGQSRKQFTNSNLSIADHLNKTQKTSEWRETSRESLESLTEMENGESDEESKIMDKSEEVMQKCRRLKKNSNKYVVKSIGVEMNEI